MKEITIVPFHKNLATVWNRFLLTSEVDTFLFHRSFMGYHAHRFSDASLLVYHKKKVLALLPAHTDGENVHSHSGLSYGGFVFSPDVGLEVKLGCYYQSLKYFYQNGFKNLFLKQLPIVYLKELHQEDEVILQWLGAVVSRTDNYSVLSTEGYKPNRNRQRAFKKAEDEGITVKETQDFEGFWQGLLVPNLKHRFNTAPVHTLEEITNLKAKFPNKIKLFSAYQNNAMKAGALVFEFENLAHFQYSAGSSDRAQTGALDALFHEIIKGYRHKKYISFGTSSIKLGNQLNQGLLYWKESFGAKSIAQKFYSINTENYKLLENRLV